MTVVIEPPADNQPLSPKRATSGPQHRDTDDLAAGIARQVRSLGRRLGERDADDLAPLRVIQAQLDAAWIVAIDGRRRSGHSDAAIAAALGVSRQAVRQRWPHEGSR